MIRSSLGCYGHKARFTVLMPPPDIIMVGPAALRVDFGVSFGVHMVGEGVRCRSGERMITGRGRVPRPFQPVLPLPSSLLPPLLPPLPPPRSCTGLTFTFPAVGRFGDAVRVPEGKRTVAASASRPAASLLSAAVEVPVAGASGLTAAASSAAGAA